MTRRWKALALGLLAVAAIGAAASSFATAEEKETKFHSETAHTVVSGHNEGTTELITPAGKLKCGKATYAGTLTAATSTEFELVPEFSECTWSGFPASVEITRNGCFFAMQAGVLDAKGNLEGAVSFLCPAGKKFDVHIRVANVLKCTIQIGPQNGLVKATYTNKGSGILRFPEVDLHLFGIQINLSPGFGLGSCSSETAEGELVGTAALAGKSLEGKSVGFWVE